jgi:hypothetical protein
LGLLAAVTLIGANSAPAQVALQYHCAGGAQLAGNTNLTVFHPVLALPSTTNFENVALARMAGLVTGGFQPGANPPPASLIEPLLSDVVSAESLGSFAGASSRAPEFILALRLDANRAQLWHDNLATVFGASGAPFASQGFNGWRWTAGASNSFWIIPARDWLLAGRGDDFLPLQVEYLQKVSALGRPAPPLQSNWLEADMDTQRLGGWLRLLQPARLKITVAANDNNLRIALRANYAQPMPWKPEPWRIPRDLIRGQLVSFTAAQDVAAFFNLNPALSHLADNPLTNQFCFWALDQMPLLNYMAWPAANAANALQQLAAVAPAAFNPDLKRFNGTELVWQPKPGRLLLRNIRLFEPALEATQGNGGQFLFLSSFPRSSKGTPAPDALLAQIEGRTNLVYYDWELTGPRLQEWQILGGLMANRALAQNAGAAEAMSARRLWLGALAPAMGNTVTEITRVAPDELSLVRSAPLGFTAAELAVLSDWLCGAYSGPINSPQPAAASVRSPGKR